jgi:hypothetical protein
VLEEGGRSRLRQNTPTCNTLLRASNNDPFPMQIVVHGQHGGCQGLVVRQGLAAA